MTPEEWDKQWWEEYGRLRHSFPTASLQVIQKATHKLMVGKYGVKPTKPPGVPGPPLWLKISALPLGVNMTKLWEWLNGKKTLMGIIITVLAWLATNVPVILPAVGIDAILVAKITGILLTVVGIAHKVYKFLYKEEHQ
jgi:hypothetical protein